MQRAQACEQIFDGDHHNKSLDWERKLFGLGDGHIAIMEISLTLYSVLLVINIRNVMSIISRITKWMCFRYFQDLRSSKFMVLHSGTDAWLPEMQKRKLYAFQAEKVFIFGIRPI